MTSLTPDQQRAAVGEKVLLLFSNTEILLSDLRGLAATIVDMAGIESFHTPVPWVIRLSDGSVIIGDSDNLNNAVKDIYAQTGIMIKNAPDAKVSIYIDNERLIPPIPSIIPKTWGVFDGN